MREIKFRGNPIDGGSWIYGYLFIIWDKHYILWGTTNNVPNKIQVIPETVSQYTGLKDCNDQEIYDKDIVEFLGINCEIWWQDNAGYWAVDMRDNTPDHLKNERTLIQYSRQMKVIGNKIQNAELLRI